MSRFREGARRLACTVAAVSMVAVSLSAPAQATGPLDPTDVGSGGTEHCSTLAGLEIDAEQIGVPTSGAVVNTAEHVSDETDGSYCKVIGKTLPVDPEAPGVTFQVNLPDGWNGKSLQFGGGAFNGTLVTGTGHHNLQPQDLETPLAQGYTTLGSDGGHESEAGFDAEFALNEESLKDYGLYSIKKAHDVSEILMGTYYGQESEYAYFIGGSQGGHEALDAAARYPDDYEGVVANYPAYNVMMLHLSSLNAGRAMYAEGGEAWLSPEDTKLLTDTVYEVCDTAELDGAVDGIISNVAGCNEVLTIDAVEQLLGCEAGAPEEDACLTPEQLAAIDTVHSSYVPGVEIAGQTEARRWPILEGALWQASNFGAEPQPSNPLSGSEGLLYSVGATNVKYLITQDPDYDAMEFDPTQWEERIQELAAITDVSDVSLEPFFDRGGKLIMTHGTADDFISPHNSDAYWEQQTEIFGEELADSARYYKVPGLGHGFGPFNATWDGLGVITGWVEDGTAPGTLTAEDANEGTDRTRPMCQYPAWPEYQGAVSEDSAGSFECVITETVADFTDNEPDSSYYVPVRWLQLAGITQGYADGSFGKYRDISRGESVAFLQRHLAPDAEPGDSTFTDVPAGSTFYTPISWAAGEEITLGYADGQFRPGQSVTRGEFASFLYRAVDPAHQGPEESEFTDVDTTDTHYEAVTWMASEGISQGYRDGSYKPHQHITRAETATLLYRYEYLVADRG
ncbi:tannase/feruloyl esterase family alpha/beta hydrolase [Citricoccus sp. K5]|uniref:tannase/feruloyl esterase family alpha/beta hydrolase n=1 Tax=Citricoccus sp. K5 TaxID=2653135 RepID=UPI0012EF0440|nr:tannase/feruloyl esterase family alpha/beta hydrolase [Citricoccus sp. K5]VXB87428.1 Feruloyl esterase [Citricoccus sp. K5]